ncbi:MULTISPECIES: tlde1 domain-containing protein [unclassified Asaia]|uniref:tlde1 domain-containing protein n=1 Tax=unclassified Asaia TaxID=2685023 RepID=UPI001F43785C|nr:tlde1 domain-containing protein [Asaia sp. SF2.1]
MVDDATGQSVEVGTGYSGHGQGLNNPNDQYTHDEGPIPQGTYNIGDPIDKSNTGPNSIPLTPADGTDTQGRNGFYMHGDNSNGNNSASDGCVIMAPSVRNSVDNNSSATTLVVTK